MHTYTQVGAAVRPRWYGCLLSRRHLLCGGCQLGSLLDRSHADTNVVIAPLGGVLSDPFRVSPGMLPPPHLTGPALTH